MGNFVDYGIRVDVLLRTKMVQDAQGNFNTNDVPGDMVPPALIAADKRNGTTWLIPPSFLWLSRTGGDPLRGP